MAQFTVLISTLRRAEAKLAGQLESVRAAISSLESTGGPKRGRPPGSVAKRAGKRKMSKAARAKISAAQKARWAKQKAEEAGAAGEAAGSETPRRKGSRKKK